MPHTLSSRIVASVWAWLALAFPLAALGQDVERPPEGEGRYAQMDHGPFFSGTIDTLFPARKSYTNKGIVIRLTQDPPAAVCFDTELLKVSAGWTGGFLGWPEGRDGIEGEPFPAGDLKFGTRPESLGWARAGKFADPRPIPYGPLPRDWAKYRGLYRHGERVVLSYSVGDAMILEMPAVEMAGDLEFFTRTLDIGRHASPLTMLVCEAGGTARRVGETVAVETSESVTAVGLVTAPRGCALSVGEGGRVELTIPASNATVSIKLAIWNGTSADFTRFQASLKKCGPAIDVKPLMAGGPSLWLPTLETRAIMGRGSGPYIVDTITVPYENPWKAYMRLSAFDFFPDGRRAAVATFDGDIWIVSGVGGTLSEITWKRYATGLFQPLGLRIVENSMYVLGRDQITRLHDLNGDDEADYYENFNNDCMVRANFHEFAMNLQTDAEGNFYYGKSASWPPDIKTDHEGTLLKVSKDGSKFEVFATGVRNPNGMSIGPDGRLAVTDNEGHWTPACWVGFAEQGDYLGMITTAHRSPLPADYVKPITYLPRDLDNSTGGVVWVTSDRWGPLENELLVLSYGKCSLFQVLIDEVEGQVQGGVIRFPLQFNTGIIRGRFNDRDGQLYVCGLRAWQSSANREGGFQRVRYTGQAVDTVVKSRATTSGIELTFTRPLDAAAASDTDRYSAERWNYRRTAEYGSDEYSVANPRQQGRDPIEIKSARLAADGKTVFLEIPDMRPVHMLRIRCRIRAADRARISLDIYSTIHRLAGSP